MRLTGLVKVVPRRAGDLVAFDAMHGKADHHAVVQLGTAASGQDIKNRDICAYGGS
jgi:hypothetical protein